jgi:LPS-assembly protein
MRRSLAAFLASMLVPTLVALPAAAGAQAPPPITDTTIAERHDVINDKQHHYIGKVEMDDGRDTKLYADDVWFYVEENRAVATGNVVFRQGTNQISADRAEFDTKTRLGTFYNASGFATAQPQRARPAVAGVVAPPPLIGQDTIVLFFGKSVEKIGPRKYKITEGGFTTCVQPTPRWDFDAKTIVLNLDHYTLLKQVVMNVKGVPLFYLPILYYPTKREDRATGFLLPTYGTSTVNGQSIHNAFFWAIDRSQDATILHDWYSKAGQGVGTEYRYNFGGGSDGFLNAHLLDQKTTDVLTATRSYQLNGSANQLLPGRFRARANVSYFSSIATNQAFNTNINDSSQSQRSFGGNVVGGRGSYAFNATIDHREYFYSQTSSAVSGSWPRISVTRNERPIQGTPFYVSASGEYVSILSDRKDDTLGETNLGVQRLDFNPQIRFPFKKWQWFTVNSTASWRDTYYSRSLDPSTIDPVTNQPAVVEDNLDRRYFTVLSQITGPLFNRVWDTPDNGYAEKFKHSIEPSLTVSRTSLIDNYDRIVKLEGIDQVVGGTIQYTYGVANRFYAKRRSKVPGQIAQAREIFTVDLRQSYYSNKAAAQFDPQYSTSNTGLAASNFGPVALSIRAQPTNELNASANAEFDSRYRALRTITVGGTYSWSTQLQSTLSWTKRGYIPELAGFNDPNALYQSLNGSSTVRTKDNKYGLIYSFNYDVFNSSMINQKMSGFYNAQCCGVAFEYQNYHFGSGIVSSVAADHRFFMSFTLAGLGNFSPFNGALGGVPR